MLIDALLDFLVMLLGLLLEPLKMDVLPAQIALVVADFIGYISAACGIIAEYTHFTYLLALLGVCIAVDMVSTLYRALMWVLRKIPILNIS